MIWTQPLLLTLQLIAVSVTIAAILGIAGAWAASILDSSGPIRRRMATVFMVSMVAAIATPMVLHAAAWESTAGKFGWLMMTQSGARADGTSRYGFFGGLIASGWIHGLVGSAIVTVTTWYGVIRTPSAIVQQSRLDFGPVAAWWRVRLPIAAPWLGLGLLATALLAATEMTVVDLYGYRTLADEFYLFYVVDASMAAVIMTMAIPMLIATWLIVALWVSRARVDSSPVEIGDQSCQEKSDSYSPRTLVMACGTALVLAGTIVVVPTLGLIIKLGHEVSVSNNLVEASWSGREALERLAAAPGQFGEEYRWTAALALLTGLVAVMIATPLAAVGRTNRWLETCVDSASVLSFVVPGPIVGLAVVSFFQSDLPGFRMLYEQTLVPTVLALSARAVPIAYWILRAAFRGIPTSVVEASRLDTSTIRRAWSIYRPLLQKQVIVALLVAGVFGSGDVPATLPVLPPGVSTVGNRLFGLLHSGSRYQEAALAIWYLIAVVGICAVLARAKLRPAR